MSELPVGHEQATGAERMAGATAGVELKLEGFALEAVERESARLGVPAADVMTFAVLYYLADLDSGRVAREIETSPFGPLSPAPRS